MESIDQPLVSVLVPVYNCESYLRECIQSVLCQTYQNWECIIVNNCSTDKTLMIAKEFSAMDSRVRIHNNEQFVRVIRNHNIAFSLLSPKSKYCKLVQADDWIFPECLEKMVELAEANPNVGLVGAYGLWGDSKVAFDGLSCRTTIISGREICRRLFLEGLYAFGSPSSNMLRSDIVRKKVPFWDESSIHADSEAYVEILKLCDFGFIHQVLSYTRKREGMTTLADNLNSYLASRLGTLVRDGAFYLSEDELKIRIKRQLNNYYKFLAKSVFKHKGPDFWRFHRMKLQEFGYPLKSLLLAWSVLSLVLDKLFNPKQTSEAIMKTLEIASSRAKSIPIDAP